MKEEERLEREVVERRLRRDLVTKTFPRTRVDFDQLYAMVSKRIIIGRFIVLKIGFFCAKMPEQGT